MEIATCSTTTNSNTTPRGPSSGSNSNNNNNTRSGSGDTEVSSSTTTILDEIYEERARRRQSIESLRSSIRSRRKESVDTSTSCSLLPSTSVSRASRVVYSTSSNDSLRTLALDLDSENDDTNNNNNNNNCISPSSVDAACVSPADTSKANDTTKSKSVIENLRQLAASLEGDNFNWDSCSDQDDDDDNNNNNNNNPSFIKRRNAGVQSAAATTTTAACDTTNTNIIIDYSNNNVAVLVDDAAAAPEPNAVVPAVVLPGLVQSTSAMSNRTNSYVATAIEEQHILGLNFCMEHKIFLKAALDLLAEREGRFAVEASLQLHDPNRIIKAGSLRKSKGIAKGIWKVKYVEIKPGVLTYYEDCDTNNDSTTTTNETIEILQQQHQPPSPYRPTRKVIPLVATECRCRAVKLSTMSKVKSTYGFIFEISIPDRGIKRLWMASSTDERQSWLHAIREAMVGGSCTRASTDRALTDYYFVSSSRNTAISTTNRHATTTTTTTTANSNNDSTTPSLASENAAPTSKGNNKKIPAWSLRSSSPATTSPNCISPYQKCIEKYLTAQQQLKCATDKQSYIGGMSILWRDPLRIPVQWIRLSIMAAVTTRSNSNNNNNNNNNNNMATNTSNTNTIAAATSTTITEDAFHEEKVETSVQQLWKDLVRDSVLMNGDLLKGGSMNGPERIMGALATKIRAFDKESLLSSTSQNKKNMKKNRISQAQAISYARDILLACNRTRSAGDSYYCMEMLCSNPDLVVICPASSEASPLNITIKHTTANDASRLAPEVLQAAKCKRGWVLVRSKKMNQWENMYCELSDGVLNYYEKEYPTPQKLRGQIVLVDAKMGSGELTTIGTATASSRLQSERYRKKLHRLVHESSTPIVDLSADELSEPTTSTSGELTTIGTTTKLQSDRYLKKLHRFVNESSTPILDPSSDDFTEPTTNATLVLATTTTKKASRCYVICIVNKVVGKELQMTFDSEEFFLSWKQSLQRSIEITSDVDKQAGFESFESSAAGGDDSIAKKNSNDKAGLATKPFSATAHNKQISDPKDGAFGMSSSDEFRRWPGLSTVQISVEASTVYKICTTDPQGDDNEDTWATIQTKFLQSFQLSGGTSGKITRGEEIVQMLLLRGSVGNQSFDRVLKQKNMSKLGPLESMCMRNIHSKSKLSLL